MAAWILLCLMLFFNLSSVMASASSDWNLQPEELVGLKNSGVTESLIQSKVEQQQLLLKEKRAEAQRFQFVAKVIPSTNIEPPGWSIASGSEMLLKFQDHGGFLSTKTRAEVVARQLNRALLIGDGQFTSVWRNGQITVIFESIMEPLVIVSVSEEDASFLQSNANEIAWQWETALNHFWKSLPPELLRPLPAALTLADLVLLAKTDFADRTLLSFFHLRDIDRAVKAEQIKGIGFRKEVAQYLAKRILVDPPDHMRRWGYWGSDYGCASTSISISSTILFGGSGNFHAGAQQRGSRSSSTRGSNAKASHAGVPGKSSNPNH